MDVFKPHFNTRIRRSGSGFTLLEILIAVFIFAIIVTTIFGSYNFVFSTAASIDTDAEIFESAKICLNRMALDLQAIYVSLPPLYKPPEMDSPPDTYRIDGKDGTGRMDFPRLRFTSLSHISFENNRADGIAEIVYHVQPTDTSTFALQRSDTLLPYESAAEKATDPILCENIKSLKFIYYDEEGTEYDHWDSESDEFKYATPRKVGIKLEIGDNTFSRKFETRVALPVYRESKR